MEMVGSVDELPERLRLAYEHAMGKFLTLKATAFIYDSADGKDVLYFDALGLHHTIRVPNQRTGYYHSAEKAGRPVDKLSLAIMLEPKQCVKF